MYNLYNRIASRSGDTTSIKPGQAGFLIMLKYRKFGNFETTSSMNEGKSSTRLLLHQKVLSVGRSGHDSILLIPFLSKTRVSNDVKYFKFSIDLSRVDCADKKI